MPSLASQDDTSLDHPNPGEHLAGASSSSPSGSGILFNAFHTQRWQGTDYVGIFSMLLFSLSLLSYFSLSGLFSHLWRLSCTCVSFLGMVLLCIVDPLILQQNTLPSTGSDSCTWSLRNRLEIQLNPSKIILQLGVTCPRMSLVADTLYHSAVAKQEAILKIHVFNDFVRIHHYLRCKQKRVCTATKIKRAHITSN